MGDGGVACVPSQHVMERFSISETFCVVNNNGNFNSKSLKVTERKMKMKYKRQVVSKKRESGKAKSNREVEKSEFCTDKVEKEEIEEGELGSVRWPRGEAENGEFIPEKPRRFELKSAIEKVGSPVERWGKGELEKGEFVPGKGRKEYAGGKAEFSSRRSRIVDDVPEKSRKREPEKAEFASWRGVKAETDKGEFTFTQERLHKSEVVKDEYRYPKMRDNSVKDKGWKCEREWTPPSKYAVEKEFSRNGSSQHSKRPSRWETGQERNPRFVSKIPDEEGSYKTSEYSNGKTHGREYSSGNRLKRHGNDSDSGDRKHYGDYGEYTSSKIRRLSDDGSRPTYSEHYSRRSVERSYRNPSSSRNISSDRYSSRHYESSMSSRIAYDKHGSSPRHSERSPRDRARYLDHRDRSPFRRERSPYDRSRNFEHRNRSPSYSERSPHDGGSRYHDLTDQIPNCLERSPLDRRRPKPSSYRETSQKTGSSEKKSSQYGIKGQEEKLDQKDPQGRDSFMSAKVSNDRSYLHDASRSVEENADHKSHGDDQSQNQGVHCKDSPQANGATEDLPSMEEDMDICDTPPHLPMVPDSTTGKWFYLDHSGVECGPSKLCDLQALVEEGFLVSDHMIKHLDSDRWVSVENAVSPLVTPTFPSIVSETITQLVSPPEAPGNLLVDIGDTIQCANQLGEGTTSTSLEPKFFPDENEALSYPLEDLHIEQRVGALLEGYKVIPGQELETMGEVLQMTFEGVEWQKWEYSEGFTWQFFCSGEQHDQNKGAELATKEASEKSTALADGDRAFACGDSSDWFSGRWSCKGGDWKRHDEAMQDRSWKKKFVLNDGYPLCQMPKSGCEDPRSLGNDELYYPSNRRLDLPPWAFSLPDELNDCNGVGRLSQSKPAVARGVKGTMLPVVRINACVVKDHGSFISEPRMKGRGKDRYASRSSRPHSGTGDVKRSLEEGGSLSRSSHQQGSWSSSEIVTSINVPKDRLCTASDLQVHLGGWYYLDGAGHEQGPLSFSELQVLADQGIIEKNSSVFRKIDRVWVPVSSAAEASVAAEASDAAVKIHQEINQTTSDTSASLIGSTCAALDGNSTVSSSFHSLHPQFIGFTRGKLHELVMKSYKSREFAAAINEVLDPWINAKLPKKEMEKYIHYPALYSKFQSSGKRGRFPVDGSEEDYEMDEIPAVQEECSFEDLCSDAIFHREDNAGSENEAGTWGLLDGHVLARVFNFLRSDVKSLVFAALTCKHWRAVLKFYKDISRQVDLSSIGHSCTDTMIWKIMNGYKKEKISSLVLLGCSNISSSTVDDIIRSFPSLSCIDIRGCIQFGDLIDKYPNINWVKSRGVHSKIRSLRHISERTSSVFRSHGGLDTHMDDSSGLRDYFESLDRRDSANQLFRRSLYKRSKLFDARRSSSILSRDAHLRRWAIKKSENSYKRMGEFLALGLKDIMKENTFEFFVPKVAEIEDRMKNGYYASHGLSSVKDDISRMCREAIKAKNRGDGGDMNRIVTLFIRLATHLEDSSKPSRERDEMLKNWKNDSSAAATSKYKKKLNKVTERKMIRSNGTSFINGGSDYGEYASDREIRKRLSRLNKKSMDSGSETSDELDRSSEETVTDSESTASDTESNLDFRSEKLIGELRPDGHFIADDGFDSLTDEREWGARMTKASLVPPVTRKYDVIDQYVIVADEEEVKRKMQVSLPDDYAEKLSAQRNGTEESDMEIPEVKDYKPRKQLGFEVIEQEVYGIDPYTHNLLLDSIPEGSDWSLQDKHLFIEDVLLRNLNKQARHFTGTGNTPMMYALRPVIEELLKTAEADHDMRTKRVCECIQKAIDGRPEDNYVAYRKGLGVVCDKEGGFGEDDFVVEFLGEVYPAWKWFEKQDGIRSLQKNSKDPAPEFYNIYLERPKGDADGYDLVVVDAMHKANYASRICHSCRPNCEAKVTAVDGQYQIGIYAVRPIEYGEEITFDYNSVTESKEEYEASVCLCGSQVCRGSYLNLTGEGAFQKVLKDWHGILDRHHLLLDACELNFVSEEDYIELGRAGLGSCLLGGLPDWLIAYSARVVRFINFERTKLPEEILRHNLEEKRKYFADISIEVERSDAEVQAEGVYNQRLQNLALTLDKVRYVMRCIFGDPKKAPPPLERLSPEAAISFIWKGEGSLVDELIQCMAPHMDDGVLNDLRSKIRAHDPSSGSDDIQKELRKSLIWLRDEVRNLPCTYKCRHDAAADLIHIYAHTKCFFRVREYKAVTSPPVYISPLDLGPKYTDKLGSGCQEYHKSYGENYCLGQLIYWHNQTNAEPDCSLARASRGCLSLPDVGSFYAKVQKPSRHRVYGPRTVKYMLARMEKQPQRPWPKDRIWSFKNSPKFFGSPMLDAVLHNSPLDKEVLHWLKHRPAIFQAMWDR